jgi:hypothetical protein
VDSAESAESLGLAHVDDGRGSATTEGTTKLLTYCGGWQNKEPVYIFLSTSTNARALPRVLKLYFSMHIYNSNLKYKNLKE